MLLLPFLPLFFHMALADTTGTVTTQNIIQDELRTPDDTQAPCYSPRNIAYEHVTLCTADIVKCMRSPERQLHVASSRVDISYHHRADKHPSNQSSLTCKLVLNTVRANAIPHPSHGYDRLKDGLHPHVEFLSQTCTRNNYVMLFPALVIFYSIFYMPTIHMPSTAWTGCEPYSDPPSFHPPTYPTRELQIVIVVKDVTKDHRVEMKVINGTASPKEKRLEVVPLLPHIGFIQPVRFSPSTHHQETSLVVDSVALTVSNNQTVMLSFRHMNIRCRENIMLSLHVKSTKDRTRKRWSRCGTLPPLPEVFVGVQEVNLSVETSGYLPMKPQNFHRYSTGNGFRMIYSFLKSFSIPWKLSDNQWNCSTPTWIDLQPHLSCNLIVECDSAQDETQCYHELCEHGGFRVKGRCYWLGRPSESMSYYEAREMCSRHGGYLASFNTKEEMDAVMDMVWWNSCRRDVFVGLTLSPPHYSIIYKPMYQREDRTIAYHPRVIYTDFGGSKIDFFVYTVLGPYCGVMTDTEKNTVRVTNNSCAPKFFYYLCEIASGSSQLDVQQNQQQQQKQGQVGLTDISVSTLNFSDHSVRCPDNHWIPDFLACDTHSKCWADTDVNVQFSRDALTAQTSSWCAAPNTSDSLYFQCSSEGLHLPFTLVCDYHADCFDGSDEDFCIHPPCLGGVLIPCGDSGQCIHESNWCNMANDHCKNSIEARRCEYFVHVNPLRNNDVLVKNIYRFPSVVHFHSDNKLPTIQYDYLTPGTKSPPTHFRCPSVPFYLPVFVRCNGVYDCPYKEDEADCETYSCPGYFSCRQSRICLHPDHVCDGKTHCPQHDDEWYCAMSCPYQCSCQGLAFTCSRVFPVDAFPDIRYLDVSGSEMKAESLFRNKMLVFLNMTSCILTELFLPELPNIKIVDVSYNQLKTVYFETLQNISNVNYLVMANNPFNSLLPSESDKPLIFSNLKILDLTSANIPNLISSRLQSFPGLVILNLSGSRIRTVSGEGFDNPVLAKLDLRGGEMMEFPHTLLKGLTRLGELYVDSFQLCCAQTLPNHFSTQNCHGPPSVFSNCDHLLGVHVQRILLYLLASFIFLGNGLMVALFTRNSRRIDTNKIFMCHLCGSKLLMGMYLSALCVADMVYSGSYLWEDRAWRSSIFCKVLAFIYLLSCEVTVFLDISMTLEKCLIVTWPDRLHGESRRWIVLCACLLSWSAGVCLSVTPTVSADVSFSQTSLCVPLPLSGDQPGGNHYAFSLLVVLNTTLMLLAVAGQTYIYITIQANTLAVLINDDKAHTFEAARRIITIVVMDACCWLLVTSWAALTSHEVWIPGDVVYSVSVLFVFISAALTPYLYLLNGVLERRRQVQKQRVFKRLRLNLKGEKRS